jgi:hypothetical protein
VIDERYEPEKAVLCPLSFPEGYSVLRYGGIVRWKRMYVIEGHG